jgi:hypothetical protein
MAVTFQRVLSDDELHRRVRAAVGSGRKVYERVGSERDIGRIATRLGRDENAQKALGAFIEDLLAASGRLREKPKMSHQLRNLMLVGGAVSAGSALAAASGRLREKPKKRHRLRRVMLLGSAVGVGTVVVIRRRRGRDDGFVVGTEPADSPTPAPAHAEASSTRAAEE